MFGFLTLLFTLFPSKCSLQVPPDLNTTDLNKQYHHTLQQMNMFLKDVEKNIQQERQYLRNIPRQGSHQITGYMEYDVTDIWWPPMPQKPATGHNGMPFTTTENPTEVPEYPQPAPEPLPSQPDYPQTGPHFGTSPAKGWEVTSSNPDATISTASTGWTHKKQLTVSDYTTEATTLDLVWGPLPLVMTTTTGDPFLQQLAEELEREGAGYFTVFLLKLFEVVAKKNQTQITELTRPLEHFFVEWSELGVFKYMGTTTADTIMKFAIGISGSPADVIKTDATMMYSLIKNRETLLTPDVKALLNYLDTLFDDQEGHRLFYALEDVDMYPGNNKSAKEVSHELMNSVVEVYMSTAGSAKRTRLHEMLYKAIMTHSYRPLRRSAFSWANNAKNYDHILKKLIHKEHKHRKSDHKKSHKQGARNKHHTRHSNKHKHKLDKIKHHHRNKHHSHHKRSGLKINDQKRFHVVNRPSHSKTLTITRPNMQRRFMYSHNEINHRNNTHMETPGELTTGAILSKAKKRSQSTKEEIRLRVEMDDMFYHGNKTFEMAPRSDVTDEEFVLKSNIYKYFGYDPDAEVKDTST